MEIRYHGWSGISVERGESLVGFDLMESPASEDVASELVLCVSHGHPDHFSGVKALSDRPEDELNARTHVISSWPVLEYIAGRRGGPRSLHALKPGEHVALDGVQIDGFGWEHMSLLPPGVRSKLDYVRHLVADPLGLARIALQGLGTPMFAPMLGFAITYEDGFTLVNYAEGLHRYTQTWEVREVARRFEPDVLCFAVEPEDVDDIPTWLSMLEPRVAFIYEAHRPWREKFNLPYVDLEQYAGVLRSRFPSLQIEVLGEPGVVVGLDEVVTERVA